MQIYKRHEAEIREKLGNILSFKSILEKSAFCTKLVVELETDTNNIHLPMSLPKTLHNVSSHSCLVVVGKVKNFMKHL